MIVTKDTTLSDIYLFVLRLQRRVEHLNVSVLLYHDNFNTSESQIYLRDNKALHTEYDLSLSMDEDEIYNKAVAFAKSCY